MIPEEKKEFAICATHEAGHAVAAHVLGFTIKTLNVINADGYGGTFAVEDEGGDYPTDLQNEINRARIRRYDVVIAAATPARELATRNLDDVSPDKRARFDEQMLHDHARQMFSTPELQDDYLVEIKAEARALVTSPPYKAAILALMDKLLVNLITTGRGSIEPENAHRIVAATIAEYSKPDGSL